MSAIRVDYYAMAATPRERISGVDTAWLRMEQPTNLMMIVGVMMFEGRLDPEVVRKTIAARFLTFRRFRQRAVQDAAGAWWEDPGELDLAARRCRKALRPGRKARAGAPGERARLDAARFRATPVAVPRDRQLRRGKRPRAAHPPLLRRRHRPHPGDALHDGRDGKGEPQGAGAKTCRGERRLAGRFLDGAPGAN
jgi:hypothetical protein